MSINFNEPVNEETSSFIKKMMDVQVDDKKTFLTAFDGPIQGALMKEIANKAGQPITLKIHNVGDVKTMADGTRYRVTSDGWERLDG